MAIVALPTHLIHPYILPLALRYSRGISFTFSQIIMTQLKGEYKVEAILHEIAVKINFDLGFLRVLAQFLISFFFAVVSDLEKSLASKKSLSCRQRRHEVYLDKGQKISESISLALILPKKTNEIIFPITALAYKF